MLIGDNLSPLVNRAAPLLKRWLTGTPRGAETNYHLDHYLDECAFRFNRMTFKPYGKPVYRLTYTVNTISSCKIGNYPCHSDPITALTKIFTKAQRR